MIVILFNFASFTRVVENVYNTVSTPYSLDNVLSVFRYFFEEYEAATGQIHPGIRRDQIARIVAAMPYIDMQTHGTAADIDPEDYPDMIDAYFQTDFPDCDYRINHFFSGQIRELRFYERLY